MATRRTHVEDERRRLLAVDRRSDLRAPAPRRALELIAASPTWLANYQVMLELVMNPKTPRQVVAKLIPKLKPADRKMIKSNPALPEAIRKFA